MVWIYRKAPRDILIAVSDQPQLADCWGSLSSGESLTGSQGTTVAEQGYGLVGAPWWPEDPAVLSGVWVWKVLRTVQQVQY